MLKYERARLLTLDYNSPDSIYLLYSEAKETFTDLRADSLVFHCNAGLIEWHTKYGDPRDILELIQQNEKLVRTNQEQIITYLEYCLYY